MVLSSILDTPLMICTVTTTSEMTPVARLNGSAMIGLRKVDGAIRRRGWKGKEDAGARVLGFEVATEVATLLTSPALPS